MATESELIASNEGSDSSLFTGMMLETFRFLGERTGSIAVETKIKANEVQKQLELICDLIHQGARMQDAINTITGCRITFYKRITPDQKEVILQAKALRNKRYKDLNN